MSNKTELSAFEKANEFLKSGNLYKLGDLETESRHPLTLQLSEWAEDDLDKAIGALVQVDIRALEKLKAQIPAILRLRTDIQSTLKAGGKIYLCGCGATGRLSLTLEVLWREMFPGDERVTAFMAGGDMALVHSLEGFEDYPEYGARHLMQLGFGEKDLLISCTEGGETPYVIGATEKAAEVSKVKPYYLYCNPDSILCERVERSRRVIQNPAISKINLSVGPMGLSGSTRMQASTVLQLAVGYALLTTYSSEQILKSLSIMQEQIELNALAFLKGFIERESETYEEKDYVLYAVRDFPITVFTDTTERAPTFSLTPFSHLQAPHLLKRPPSLCYITLPDAKDAKDAWQKLLKRQPRALNWTDIDPRTSDEYMNAFDFSDKVKAFRAEIVGPDAEHRLFEIRLGGDRQILWSFMDHERALTLAPGTDWQSIEVHTLLKMLINIHSTLLMGRIGRYKNNVMTWVFPTNGKLIDRASRYALGLLRDEGIEAAYDDVVRELFAQLEIIKPNESIVLKTVEGMKAKS